MIGNSFFSLLVIFYCVWCFLYINISVFWGGLMIRKSNSSSCTLKFETTGPQWVCTSDLIRPKNNKSTKKGSLTPHQKSHITQTSYFSDRMAAIAYNLVNLASLPRDLIITNRARKLLPQYLDPYRTRRTVKHASSRLLCVSVPFSDYSSIGLKCFLSIHITGLNI